MNVTEALEAAQQAQADVLAAQATLEALIADRDTHALRLVDEGFTYAEAGALLGLSHGRIGQIVKAHRAKLVPRLAQNPAERLAGAREAFHLATVAQELRCEAEAMSYGPEVARFYRESDTPASDTSEDRVRWSGFHRGLDRERAEAS